MPEGARPPRRRLKYRAESTLWDAASVRALRERLGATQGELADELGVRQQTVSEWETGVYRPRGASARLLSMVAEQNDFPYRAESSAPADPPRESASPEAQDRDAAR